MKKSIFFVLTLSAMAFSSCMSEEEMFQPLDNSLATIELNISNNEELNVSTRAIVSDNDLGKWYATVSKDGGTVIDGITKASDLKDKAFQPGNYTFKVSSHNNLAASYANGNSAGGAYYEATVTKYLNTGVNPLTFDCGTAQNSKITVNWSGANNETGLTFNYVEARQGSRTYTYSNTGGSAFFEAGPDKTVNCTLHYTFNGSPKTITKTINVTEAATNYKLTITANTNGSITITINYADFTEGGETTVTIDAATGTEETTQTSGTGE